MAVLSGPSGERIGGGGISAARWLAIVGLAVLCVVAGGETIRRTVAHRYEQSDPRLALAWEPADAAARETLANQDLASALAGRSRTTGASALGKTEADARRALLEGPSHWAALRDLGFSAELAGDADGARAIMIRAALRGHRDVALQGWWLQQALRSGDYPGAVGRLDAMLRTEPDLAPRLYPIVATLVSIPSTRPEWTRRLVANPPWRPMVLGELVNLSTDPASTAALFRALKASASPADQDELGVFLSRFAATGRFAEAKAAWTELNGVSAAASVAAPYDGAFRKAPGSAPFNWRLPQLASGSAQMQALEHGQGELAVAYPASAKETVAEQLETLPAGAYQLRARWKVTQAASGGAVAWNLTCAGTNAPLGEWKHGVDIAGDWMSFDAAVVVPPGCPAQWLRLSSRAGDGFGDVGAAFTDLSIVPNDRVASAR